MILDIDGTHRVELDDGSWMLTSTTGRIASVHQRRPPPRLHYSGPWDLAAGLVCHGLIPRHAVQAAERIEERAEELASRIGRLHPDDRFSFGDGRFTITRDGSGNVTLRNPTEDVRRLRDSEQGCRTVVGYCRTVAQALTLAVLQSFAAAPGTTPYASLEAELSATAERLWSEAFSLDAAEPVAEQVAP